MSNVAIVRCENYEQEAVDKAVRDACLACPFPPVSGKKVLLKPNILSDAKVEKSITTHPAIVRAVIHLLKERGASRVFIGDSPGIQTPGFLPRESGIEEVAESEGATWVDFTEKPVLRTVPYTRGMSLPFARVLDECDLVITLPKFKTHKLMYVTGALKNQFGLIPGLHKSACHVKCMSRVSFANLIVGINAVVKPAFALMDGIIAMEGDGPANGIPRHVGLILASADPVALDVAEAKIMGYETSDIPIIESALRHGLGEMPDYPLLDAASLAIRDFRRIEVEKGSHLMRNLIGPIFTRPFAQWSVKRRRAAPLFGSPSCVLCLRCVKICPAKALTVKEKKIVIDTRSCVRCYCCHEVCPANAITIKGGIGS